MQEVHLKAFEPIPFPQVEPGFTFNANSCRNPICPDFGFGPAPDMDAYVDRCKLDGVDFPGGPGNFKCKFCEGSWRPLSNRSLREAYIWFKSQSIPFAACANESCKNYGINAFENRGCYRDAGHAQTGSGRPAAPVPRGRQLHLHRIRGRLSGRVARRASSWPTPPRRALAVAPDLAQVFVQPWRTVAIGPASGALMR